MNNKEIYVGERTFRDPTADSGVYFASLKRKRTGKKQIQIKNLSKLESTV